MEKEFKCLNCSKVGILKFPDEFQGHPLGNPHGVKDYVDFREVCRNDYSYGLIGIVDGENTWICPECAKDTILYG